MTSATSLHQIRILAQASTVIQNTDFNGELQGNNNGEYRHTSGKNFICQVLARSMSVFPIKTKNCILRFTVKQIPVEE